MMERYDETTLRSILGGDIEVPDKAADSLRHAYEGIRANARKASAGRTGRTAARRARRAGAFGFKAAAAICAVTICTTGVVYAATQGDLLGTMFGTQGRASAEPELITHVFSDEEKAIGKEDFEFMMPGREYLEPTADELAIVQPYVREVGETVMAGDCSVTVLSAVSDGQRGVVSFKVERPSGLPELEADSPGAVIKGVKVTDEAPVFWHITDGSGDTVAASKLTMDKELSSGTCWHLTESYVVTEGDFSDGLLFNVFQPTEAEEDGLPLVEAAASIDISSEPLPVSMLDASPLSASTSALGMSLEGVSIDDCKSLELVYSDGSVYTVFDRGDAPMDNTNYICGFDGAVRGEGFNLVFNRIVDWDKVAKVLVNGEELLF